MAKNSHRATLITNPSTGKNTCQVCRKTRRQNLVCCLSCGLHLNFYVFLSKKAKIRIDFLSAADCAEGREKLSGDDESKRLIEACLTHAPYAWEQFVDCYLPHVIRITEQLHHLPGVGHLPFNPNEIAIEVFRRLNENDYQELRNFRFDASFYTYLSVLTYRTAMHLASHQKN